MNTYRNLTIFVLLFLTFSCKKEAVESDPSNFRDELIAYTRGTISSTESIEFIFKNDVLKDIDPVITWLSISPHVEGELIKSSDNHLVFKPSSPYKNGATYNISLDLPAINSVAFNQPLNYSIDIVKQYLDVSMTGVEVNKKGAISYLLKMVTSDATTQENITECLNSDAKDIRIDEVSNKEYNAILQFSSGLKPNSKISWQGQPVGAESKGTISLFDLKKFESFDVLYSQYDKRDRSYSIYFTKYLDQKQELSGLLLVGDKAIQGQISKNRIRVFLDDFSNREEFELKLSKGIKSNEGLVFEKNRSFIIQPPISKPAVQFVENGNYIPTIGDIKIPIKTRNLKSIQLSIIEVPMENVRHYLSWSYLESTDLDNFLRYGKPVYFEEVNLNKAGFKGGEWSTYGIDLTDKFERNPGSMYSLRIKFGPQDTWMSCGDSFSKLEIKSNLENEKAKWADYGKRGYVSYYDDEFYDYNYNWEERDDPCKLSYYSQDRSAYRNIMASDIGIIAKQGDNSAYVAALDLHSLASLKNADVVFYDRQGVEIIKTITSDQGLCKVNLDRYASVVLVKNGSQRVFLKLDQNYVNDLSSFSTSGTASRDSRYYLYSDRGVWRPGDDIYLNLMINKRISDLPDGLPVQIDFFNHKGILIDKQTKKLDSEQLIYSFHLKTELKAETGNYRAVVRIGTEKISKTIPIETIKPNDIEIIYALDDQKEHVIESSSFQGTAKVNFLNGHPLKSADVEMNAIVMPQSQPFDKWRNYSFSYPLSINKNIALGTEKTGPSGELPLDSEINFKSYNAKSKLLVETTVNLPGGGVNTLSNTFLIDPFEEYVGVKNKRGDSWRGSIQLENGEVKIPIVILGRDGNLVKGNRSLKVTIKKNKKSWWMDHYSINDQSYYQSRTYWESVKTETITAKNGIAEFRHKKLTGLFQITVYDPEGGHKASSHFTVWSPSAMADVTQGPSDLWIDIDKDECKIGEEINLEFPEFAEARALISIEQGGKIIESFWKDVRPNNKSISVHVDESWYPNVHIHTTLVQKYGEDANDRPLRMYSIQSLKVTQGKEKLVPKLQMPEKAEPEKEFVIKVEEEHGRAMQYTLAVVDEGLLNITGFRTPDPKAHFSGSLALNVQTWDIYQWLMNYFKGDYAGIINVGGDDAYEADVAPDFNRFKPVVRFFGPISLAAGQTMEHKITLNNYIGKVRVMLVACDQANFASEDGFISIKSPLMLQAQLPRSLNVKDKVEIPVTVFRDDASINNATLSVDKHGKSLMFNSKSENVNFTGEDQTMISLDMEVANIPGKTDIEFLVKSGSKSMREKTTLVVNYPNSYKSDSKSQKLDKGQEANILLKTAAYAEYSSNAIRVSGLRLPRISEYAESLIRYPYGCLEQTTSAGFAQLFLSNIIDLTPEQKKNQELNIGAALTKLQSFHSSNGRMSMWGRGRYYHGWAEVYVGYFMKEAETEGYKVPSSLWKKYLDKQVRIASSWNIEHSDYYSKKDSERVQAYRLFVLAKSGEPVLSAMNRLMSSMDSDKMNYFLLAGAYQLAGFEKNAKKLLDRALNLPSYNTNGYYYGHYTYGSHPRNLALFVDVLSLFPDREKQMEEYYLAMVSYLENRRYASTQTKSYVLLATSRYLKGNKASLSEKIQFEIEKAGDITEITSDYWKPREFKYNSKSAGSTIKIRNTKDADIFVEHVHRYIPDELVTTNSNSGIELKASLNGKSLNNQSAPVSIAQGEEVFFSVTVRNTTPSLLKDMALNLKMPSGLELLNPRVYKTEKQSGDDQFIHQDYRDDRVYTFFKIEGNRSVTFKFKARAAFKGDFLIPSVSCEHMYRGDISSIIKTNRLIIE